MRACLTSVISKNNVPICFLELMQTKILLYFISTWTDRIFLILLSVNKYFFLVSGHKLSGIKKSIFAEYKKNNRQIKVSFRQACLTCCLFTNPLANARGSDTRQANKSEPRITESEPRVTESEPRALASGFVNNS